MRENSKFKSTTQLMTELKGGESLEHFLKRNSSVLDKQTFAEYLGELMKERNANKKEVIKKSLINEIYCYQIFAGSRMPTKDKIIAIALALQLDLDETQRLLSLGGAAVLYPKNSRDCVLINAINTHSSVSELNRELFERHMDCLK